MPYGTLNTGTITPGSGNTLTINEIVDGTAIKDEDAMGSNSADHLATQQSIKAYADALKTNSSITTLGTVTAGNLSHADIVYPDGHVLQILSTAKRDVWSTNSNNSFAEVTGFNVAITPTTTSNKILVTYNICISHDAGSHGGVATAIYRGGSILTDATASAVSGSQVAVTTFALAHETDASSGGFVAGMTFLDSPASTSEQTYAVYVRNCSGSAFYSYVNRVQNDTTDAEGTRSISTITVMEVVA